VVYVVEMRNIQAVCLALGISVVISACAPLMTRAAGNPLLNGETWRLVIRDQIGELRFSEMYQVKTTYVRLSERSEGTPAERYRFGSLNLEINSKDSRVTIAELYGKQRRGLAHFVRKAALQLDQQTLFVYADSQGTGSPPTCLFTKWSDSTSLVGHTLVDALECRLELVN
jgi:hypothetical protein